RRPEDNPILGEQRASASSTSTPAVLVPSRKSGNEKHILPVKQFQLRLVVVDVVARQERQLHQPAVYHQEHQPATKAPLRPCSSGAGRQYASTRGRSNCHSLPGGWSRAGEFWSAPRAHLERGFGSLTLGSAGARPWRRRSGGARAGNARRSGSLLVEGFPPKG